MSATLAARLDFSIPHPLRDRAEYDAAAAEVNTLLDADPPAGSPDYERLVFLSILIEAYDAEHYPDDEAGLTPQSAVAFALEQHGMTRADLAPLMGGRSRVSDFFNGKRALSIGQMQTLRATLGIPADLLLPPPPVRSTPRKRAGAKKSR